MKILCYAVLLILTLEAAVLLFFYLKRCLDEVFLMKRYTILTIVFLFIVLYSFGKLSIVTTIPPLGYAIREIGGDTVEVNILVKAGDNPHTYAPTPAELLRISKASGFVALGLGMDDWITDKVRSINSSLPVLNVSDGLSHLVIGKANAYNPHIWLDVKLYELICVNICDFLMKLDPRDDLVFAKNLGRLLAKLNSLDSQLRNELMPIKGRDFIAQHPAWDYFARAYGLGKEYFLETGAGGSIGPKSYKKILDIIKKEHIKAIIGDLVTPSKLTESVAAEAHVDIVKLNPISTFDYFELLEGIANGFLKALK